jgi:hypothetical protein
VAEATTPSEPTATTPVAATTDGTTATVATVATDAAESSKVRTVEETEAEWRHRMSERDRAHNAELAQLRQNLSALQEAEKAKAEEVEAARRAKMSAEELVRDQVATLERQLEEERRGRVLDSRKARFPNIAADLDDASLAVMDEGKLAALEAKLSGRAAPPPSLIDQNSAARNGTGSPANAPSEKTSDQLKQDLVDMAPAFAKEISYQRE